MMIAAIIAIIALACAGLQYVVHVHKELEEEFKSLNINNDGND